MDARSFVEAISRGEAAEMKRREDEERWEKNMGKVRREWGKKVRGRRGAQRREGAREERTGVRSEATMRCKATAPPELLLCDSLRSTLSLTPSLTPFASLVAAVDKEAPGRRQRARGD